MAAPQKDSTFAPDRVIRKMLARYPTPFFLYSEEGIRKTAKTLQEAFSWNSGFCQFFPMRLNPAFPLLQIMKDAGMGVQCSSYLELLAAKKCGFDRDHILYAPSVCLPEAEALAEELDCVRVIDGPHALPYQPPRKALLCYNPGGRLRFAAMDRNLLGMKEEELLTMVDQLHAFGTESIGLIAFLRFNELNPDYYPTVAKMLFEFAVRIREKTGVEISCCNLGDGLGVPYRTGFTAPDPHECAAQIREYCSSILIPAGLEHVAVHTALGRYIMAENGIFVSRIAGIKTDRRVPLLILDAAGSQFGRPTPFQEYHQMHVLGKLTEKGTEIYDVTGCEFSTNEQLADHRIMARANIGDYLVIHTAGIHNHVLSAPGLGFPPCGEYLLCADESVREVSAPFSEDAYFAFIGCR